jgi:H+/Cl- antiporter ClcA
MWFAGACGVVVAALGWASGGSSFGSGYLSAAQAIDGQAAVQWHAPLTRFFATAATYFSGIPGGIFAPSLAIGTALGNDLAQYSGLAVSTHAWIALCMTAFLSKTVSAAFGPELYQRLALGWMPPVATPESPPPTQR